MVADYIWCSQEGFFLDKTGRSSQKLVIRRKNEK